MEEFLKSLPSAIASGGVACIMLWYVATRLVPKLMDDNKAAIERKDAVIEAAYLAKDMALAKLGELKDAEVKQARVDYLASLDKVIARMADDLKDHHEHCERRHQENRQEHAMILQAVRPA